MRECNPPTNYPGTYRIYFTHFLTTGAKYKIANVTNTNAIAQLLPQTIKKVVVPFAKPKFTNTITPETKNVAMKLISNANFTSFPVGFAMLFQNSKSVTPLYDSLLNQFETNYGYNYGQSKIEEQKYPHIINLESPHNLNDNDSNKHVTVHVNSIRTFSEVRKYRIGKRS